MKIIMGRESNWAMTFYLKVLLPGSVEVYQFLKTE
jgi:hypothetical protein